MFTHDLSCHHAEVWPSLGTHPVNNKVLSNVLREEIN